MKDEVKWYLCTNREEMLKLLNVGFDYKNFRREKWNEGLSVYYFERTQDLQEYLNKCNGGGYHNAKRRKYYEQKDAENNRSN